MSTTPDTTDTTTAEAAMPGPDWAALEAEGAALEAAHAPAPVAPVAAAPAGPSTADELRGALEMARMMLAPVMAWWPEFGDTWNDGTLGAIAENGGAIMDRHGWSMGGVLSEWGPYIGLTAAVLPPAAVTYRAMQDRRERERRAAIERQRAQGGQPAGA